MPEKSNKKTNLDLACDVIVKWQQKLHGESADTGLRAELRRARTLDQIPLTRAYHEMERDVVRNGVAVQSDWLACVAGLLPYLKKSHTGSFASLAAMPKKKGSTTPRLSDLRFRRLLKRDKRSDLFLPLIRVLVLVEGEANVQQLATDLYWWEAGPAIRQRWAREYYTQLLSLSEITTP